MWWGFLKKYRGGYCELGINLQYTGIYIGNNEIIELNGDGYRKKLSSRLTPRISLELIIQINS